MTGPRRHDDAPACPTGGTPDHTTQTRLITLLADTATGNRTAFAEFYRTTSPRVYGLALRIARNPTTAEDITQEVFLQTWTLAHQYDPTKASPIGWLMMLTHRRAVDRVRTEQTTTNRDLTYGHTHLGRDHDTVAETVHQKLDEQAVQRCLDTMTELQRQAIALAYYGGHTYTQVAHTLDTPLPTIKSRIRDGLKRLENCLTGATR